MIIFIETKNNRNFASKKCATCLMDGFKAFRRG